MTVAHKDLTGVHLHEPKGIENADSGDIYIADGAGSGAWTALEVPEGTFTKQYQRFTSSGTWTKPSNCFMVVVYCQGGGQGGGSGGGTGGSTTFGSHLTGTGGGAAVGSSGDLNLATTGAVTYDGTYYALTLGSVPFSISNATGANSASYPGAHGNMSIKSFLASTLGATVTVTIGNGGSVGSGGLGTASTGMCLVESYIAA